VTDIAKWAEHLLEAEARRQAVPPITDAEPGLRVDEAYEIQDELVRRRVARGETVAGAKLGLTSRAKQRAMGVDEPVYGVLTDAMLLAADQPLALDGLIHPRAEPEIVFILGEDLAGPGVTLHDVLDATAAVCCGLEVIDSRYEDFRFTLADVVADNTSAARFVLGPRSAVPDFDLALVGCVLEVDGIPHETAAGAAVLGHPAEAVALLANRQARLGRSLRAGWVVLSGGLTNAVPLHAGGHVAAAFGRLGRVSLRSVAGGP
jgi:2-oxo-3-hexenedioate decarboxylase